MWNAKRDNINGAESMHGEMPWNGLSKMFQVFTNKEGAVSRL
jgi:hypothetical protein